MAWIVVGTVTALLTDNGPEYVGRAFQDHLVDLGIDHRRIPPRSPNYNAVCERFQGTMLQECWRPTFRRRRFNGRRELQAQADAWLVHYNTRRRNHGEFMTGRMPSRGPRQPPQEQGSMTTNYRVQLSPRLPGWKP